MRKFYNILGFMAAIACLAASSTAPAEALDLEGGKVYGFVAKTGSYYMTAGTFYSFDAAAPSVGTKVGNAAMISTKPDQAGTFLSNGDFIGVGGTYTKTFMRLSLGSDDYWTMSKSASISNLVTDFAVDGETVYAWYQPQLGSWSLGKVDIDALTITAVGSPTSTKIRALAAGDGKVWGIATDGNLYSIDKTSGTLTKVGSTGKSVADVAQSACYDSASGSILWSRYDDSSMFNKVSEIVAVNPSTGASSTKGSLTNTPQVLGIYVPASFSADAPGEVTSLAATNDGTNNNITVTFTMPTVNYSGSELNPNLQGLTYTISVDGEVKVSAKASTVGAQVSETVASTPGTHEVAVFASQSLYGDGPEVTTSLFVGMDTPGAVKNPKAVSTGTEVTVTWEAPDGKNGGSYDNAKLAYKVVRMPGNVTVAASQTATTLTETVNVDKLQGFTYVITTIYDGAEGESAQTPQVFAGPSFEVSRANPYTQNFQNCATADDAGFFAVGTAQYSGTADPHLSLLTQDANKYLQLTMDQRALNPKVFTTALKLKSRHTYRLSFKFRSDNRYGASFSVYLADKPTADCNNVKTLMAEKSYGYPDDAWQQFTEDRVTPVTFQVDETGVYFVSVQHTFMAGNWDFDDFKVEDITEPGVPNTPTDMKAEAPAGERTVNVSFTLPTEDNNGDDPEITSVELKRDNAVVNTWTSGIAAGAPLTWTDENAPLGEHTYSVTASNANGTSAAASANVKVGRDYDVEVVSAEAPESVVKGRLFTISAKLHNNGINRAPMGEQECTLALVRLKGDGSTEIVKTWDEFQLESDAEMSFAHSLTVPQDAAETVTYYFYLTYDMDENEANNRSENMDVAVVTPAFPAATDLAAVWNDGQFDLTWTAPVYDAETVTLAGYNVFANGEKVNTELVTTTSYSAAAQDDTEYKFTVVAVYDLGDSEASNEVTVSHSGVAGVAGGSFAVSTNGSVLSVSGVSGNVAVYSASGSKVAAVVAAGSKVSFRLVPGVYIVVADGKTVKVIL